MARGTCELNDGDEAMMEAAAAGVRKRPAADWSSTAASIAIVLRYAALTCLRPSFVCTRA